MPQYKIVAGTFHVKGFQPDGDSIRFQANKPEHWDFFQWETEADKAAKKKQLRVESIDALETHYEGYHQPRPFALAALESLLELLNINSVTYSLSVTQIVDADDGKAGFIASATTDRFGRPVSYIFPKNAKLTDGAIMDQPPCPSKTRSIFSSRARDWCIPRSIPLPIEFSPRRSAQWWHVPAKPSAASGP